MSGIFSFFSNRKKKEEDEVNANSNTQSNNTLNASSSSVSSGGSSSPSGSFAAISAIDNQPPLNEIQILSAHSEAVKTLLKIDDDRLASAGDDCFIYIWSIETGQVIRQLRGHSNRVTCLLYYNNDILVSGSMDRTIRMWDLSTNNVMIDPVTKMTYIEPFKLIPKTHNESVKFLEKIPNGFCSASNDDVLLLWKENGDFERSITRIQNDYINGILCVNNNYILTAGSTIPYLVAYKLDEVNVPAKTLSGPVGCVNCLMNISDKYFVTGSRPSEEAPQTPGGNSSTVSPPVQPPQPPTTPAAAAANSKTSPKKKTDPDKTIIIWNASDFSIAASVSTERPISYLYKITENFLLATIYKGFGIYDLNGTLVLEYLPEDPDSTTEINGAISLYDNTRLISWADVRLSVWCWNLKDIELSLQQQNKKRTVVKPIMIGEMRGHTDYMNCLTVLDDHSIATGSSDKQIILWKDGKYQSSIRNHLAGVSLFELYNPSPLLSHSTTEEYIYTDDDRFDI
ncbi:hypothetical protein DFA_11521 [Cavenderia fasciculata]|uniref:WD40 repeat-containing protein n=1 Tax=Cavenderia fasciculata TaxID=261658 RepID=F4QDD2_CACFS|nr:uncharacterized protein DFA_11521 [Cavenderia fasciculata]EGG13760.1 hypothetical protein DFA_11521 [Cavenderia fasciculata]|eukprot:XP_004350468.1 hypothetical protein DFA_11521 [Cavenderia fasciculata]